LYRTGRAPAAPRALPFTERPPPAEKQNGISTLTTSPTADAASVAARSSPGPPLQAHVVLALAVLGFGGLVAMAWSSPRPFFYDEAPYLHDGLATLEAWGVSSRALLEYPQPAGFSFGLLHHALKPITNLEPSAVRLVNPLFLLLIIWLCQRQLKRSGVATATASAWTLVCVPFVWVLSGLALTEMAGMVCAMLGFCLAVHALRDNSLSARGRLAAAVAGGVALGAAFYGRPPLLVIAGGLVVFGVGRRQRWGTLAVVGGSAAALIAPAVVLWGVLVPPKVQHFDSLGFSAPNMFASLGYSALVMGALAPAWFRQPVKATISWFLAGALVNTAVPMVQLTPFATVTKSILAPWLVPVVTALFGSALVGLGFVFLAASVRRIWERRGDTVWLASTLSMLFIVLSVGKITHQFSSRYTGVAAPLMVLAAAPYQTFSWPHVAALTVGLAGGVISLVGYLLL
jgi:hypothetical protein